MQLVPIRNKFVYPKLKRLELLNELKQGSEITGVTLSNPEPVLSVRTR
mgnify:CR=1 FL=1